MSGTRSTWVDAVQNSMSQPGGPPWAWPYERPEPILASAGVNGKLQEAHYPTARAAGQDLQPNVSRASRTRACGERATEACVHTHRGNPNLDTR